MNKRHEGQTTFLNGRLHTHGALRLKHSSGRSNRVPDPRSIRRDCGVIGDEKERFVPGMGNQQVVEGGHGAKVAGAARSPIPVHALFASAVGLIGQDGLSNDFTSSPCGHLITC